jgi:hypothetical protein
MATAKPKLTIAKVLRWADAHRRRTGRWPSNRSGPIPEAPGDTWSAVASALADGLRGLPAGQTLPLLLTERRGRRTRVAQPPLTEAQVLAWADAYHEQTGRWPTAASGPVRGAPGETWRDIGLALRRGRRGLPGGDSLPRLLVRHGRKPRRWDRPSSWTAEQDALLRTLSPVEAARRTGRPLAAVYRRRHQLNLIDAGQGG